MKLQFLGANRQVTGSRYLLEAGGVRILIDCGMFQEREFQERNWAKSPIPPAEIDAVLLTHAHLDHCGLLPKLVGDGFRAPIYATEPTVELAAEVLRDSAEIQIEDAEYKKRRHQREGRQGKFPEIPLYTEKEVDITLRHFRGVKYGENVAINNSVSVRFHDAGHILGSAMLDIEIREGGKTQRVIFSGDLGQRNKPIIRDPSYISAADYLVMESTYGDRDHVDHGDVESQLAAVINETVGRGGNVVIPTFAIERAQELVFFLNRLVAARRIPAVNVFLDSPMASDVTDIFSRYREYFDSEMWQMIANGQQPLSFRNLHFARSADESKAINNHKLPAVIMSTSGMCNAGRIKHHLRQNLSRSECTILFVGYQSEGTLGRIILNGAKEVRIHGKNQYVRARIAQIYGFSGHADRRGLLDWLAHFKEPPQRVFLTHGEERAALSLADEIRRIHQWQTDVPSYGQVFDL